APPLAVREPPRGAGDGPKLANINEPQPQAMQYIVGANSGWMHMLGWLGLFGLVASFNGIMVGEWCRTGARAREGILAVGLA
ncbi:hypothetical protein AAHH78_37525, partial [Burkholderia pseudomallei]